MFMKYITDSLLLGIGAVLALDLLYLRCASAWHDPNMFIDVIEVNALILFTGVVILRIVKRAGIF